MVRREGWVEYSVWKSIPVALLRFHARKMISYRVQDQIKILFSAIQVHEWPPILRREQFLNLGGFWERALWIKALSVWTCHHEKYDCECHRDYYCIGFLKLNLNWKCLWVWYVRAKCFAIVNICSASDSFRHCRSRHFYVHDVKYCIEHFDHAGYVLWYYFDPWKTSSAAIRPHVVADWSCRQATGSPIPACGASVFFHYISR